MSVTSVSNALILIFTWINTAGKFVGDGKCNVLKMFLSEGSGPCDVMGIGQCGL